LVHLLRLVDDQHINREPTATVLRPSYQLDTATIRQEDALLAVHVPHALDQGIQLRELRPRVALLTAEEVLEAAEVLLRRLHLVRRVENPLPTTHHAEQLTNLNQCVLAVLARHRQTTRQRRPLTPRLRQPVIQNAPLPRIRLQPIISSQIRRKIPKRPIDVTRNDPKRGLLTVAQQDGARSHSTPSSAHHSRTRRPPPTTPPVQPRSPGTDRSEPTAYPDQQP